MRNLREEVEQLFAVIYKIHPKLKDMSHWSFKKCEEYGIRFFSLHFEFPSEYRDEVISISKFCGINFEHEFFNLNVTTLWINFI
jgi:hypothetical protein